MDCTIQKPFFLPLIPASIMQLFLSEHTDPAFNLALEEILLKQKQGEYIVIYRNDLSVISGKHQNIIAETDPLYCYEAGIPLYRRMSGGGTVVHDPGNINFSFVLQGSPGHQVNFPKYTEPVIHFLRNIGLNAIFGGHNDIRIGNRKVSGNAEHVFKDRVLHHGTLLFESDIPRIKRCLTLTGANFRSNSVSSVPAQVANISDLISARFTIDEFILAMTNSLMSSFNNVRQEHIPENIEKESFLLAEKKYRTKDWVYGYAPAYSMSKKGVFQTGYAELNLNVKGGRILDSELIVRRNGGGVFKESGRLIGEWHIPSNISYLLDLYSEDSALSKEEMRNLLF